MRVELKSNTYFAYIKELEYMVALSGILADNLDGQLCREIYGAEFVQKIRKLNPEMCEIFNTIKYGGIEFLEFLVEYEEEFTLDGYKQYILQLPLVEFVYQFFGYRMDKEEIEKGLVDESYLSLMYSEGKFPVSSFINLKQILFHRDEIVKQYFTCVDQIRTPEVETYLSQCERQIAVIQDKMEQMAQTMSVKEIQDTVRKYSIRNCHIDQEINYFIPSFLLPRNSVIYRNQTVCYILYSSDRIMKQEQAMNTLKVISDDTRLRIIDLLSERKTANGKTIARLLEISPSTVSHHMDQLVECNMVKEEKYGNAKLYSIDAENAYGFIEELKGILLKNKSIQIP